MTRTLLILLVFATPAFADGLAVLPSAAKLTGPEARQRVLVQRIVDGGHADQVNDVELSSSDPKVVTIDNGLLVPAGNGQATVTATANGMSATMTVSVEAMDKLHVWDFRTHVEPVLAKTGCNGGACHGALAGKGGFKLTLRGYDPAVDWHTITRQARGRRIEPSDPGRSLLLAKPSGAIPHKGGLRFEVGSRDYRVLAEWISQGANPPKADGVTLERLEVLPERVLVQPGKAQQMVVIAHYSDGHSEDVTGWAKYTSANEVVATVDEAGQVSVMGYGEGAITAWFSSQIVVARITSPYPNQIPAEVYAQAERRNFIDELVVKQLARVRVAPSGRCSDGEFLRRAHLDTIGTLPTAEEARALPRRPRQRQARPAHRTAALTAGVRRLLDLHVVRRAAAQRPAAAAGVAQGVLRVGPQTRGEQYAVGPVRP